MKLKTIAGKIFGKKKVNATYVGANGAPWLTIRCEADSSDMAIEGTIGESFYDESGTSSKQFRDALDSIPEHHHIHLHINSPGGAVGDALSIHNQTKERGNVTCHVDGYALSSASVIALGGEKCVMPKSAIMMIHDPMSQTYGNEDEHQKAINMLSKHAETMANIYAEKTGMTHDEARELMKKETWMSGEDAHEMGFTDELDDDPEEDTSALKKVAAIDFSQFKNVPQAVMALAQISQTTKGAGLTNSNKPAPPTGADAVIMNKSQMIALLKTWGVQVDETKVTDQELTELIGKGKPVIAREASDGISRAEFEAMKERMQAEKKARIEARLDALIGEQKLSNDEREVELNLCLADESRLENVIAKRPSQFEAGLPIGRSVDVEVVGDFMDRVKAIKATSGEGHLVGGMDAVSASMRFRERRDNWAAMYQQALAMDRRSKPRAGKNSNPAVQWVQAMPLPGTDTGYMLPVAASTYSTSLIVDQLADGAITQLVNVLAPLRVFTRDFMASPFMPLSTVQVRLVTQGGQLTKNVKPTGSVTTTTTDYEAAADHAVTNVPVVMTEYSEAFMTTSGELMSGLRIENLAQHALTTLGSQIIQDTLTLLNNFQFTGGALGGSITAHYGTWTWNSASSTVNDMAVLRAQLGKSTIKNAVLDPVLFSKLITIPVANQMQVGMPLQSANTMQNIMGWNEIAETSAWATGQGAGGSTGSFPQPIIGFACNPQAFAVAARLPLLPPEGVPGNTVTMATVPIPGLDLSIAIFQWFSVRYRTLFHSYGIVYGPAIGDTTAGCIVKSLGI